MALWLLPKRRFLCVGAKANVPLCGGKKMNKKCAVGKKKKYTRVSKECRLTRCPVSIWSVFVCLSVKMVYFSCPSVRYCQVARSSVTLAANVRRLCDGAAIANRQMSFVLKIYRITEDEHMTSGSTIAKPLVARCALYPGIKKWQVSISPAARVN